MAFVDEPAMGSAMDPDFPLLPLDAVDHIEVYRGTTPLVFALDADDLVFSIDADGQFNPADIPALAEPVPPPPND